MWDWRDRIGFARNVGAVIRGLFQWKCSYCPQYPYGTKIIFCLWLRPTKSLAVKSYVVLFSSTSKWWVNEAKLFDLPVPWCVIWSGHQSSCSTRLTTVSINSKKRFCAIVLGLNEEKVAKGKNAWFHLNTKRSKTRVVIGYHPRTDWWWWPGV